MRCLIGLLVLLALAITVGCKDSKKSGQDTIAPSKEVKSQNTKANVVVDDLGPPPKK
jgi:hypothetical protein